MNNIAYSSLDLFDFRVISHLLHPCSQPFLLPSPPKDSKGLKRLSQVFCEMSHFLDLSERASQDSAVNLCIDSIKLETLVLSIVL